MIYVQWFSSFLKKASGLCLLAMMLLTCADVIGGLFGYPILGAEELVALMASVLLAFALPAAHIAKANVGVELLYMKLSSRLKTVNDCLVTLVSIVLFSLITWQCFLYAKDLRSAGEVTMTLQFPAYLLIFGIAFALMVLCFIIIAELVTLLKGGKI